MTETTSLICINCPIGCPLELVHEGNEIIEVSGHQCNRGAKYAQQEFSDPRRSISTTVPIKGAIYKRLPVKTTAPVPKALVMQAVHAIHELHLEAPIECGQILISELLNEPGINVVASRSMRRETL